MGTHWECRSWFYFNVMATLLLMLVKARAEGKGRGKDSRCVTCWSLHVIISCFFFFKVLLFFLSQQCQCNYTMGPLMICAHFCVSLMAQYQVLLSSVPYDLASCPLDITQQTCLLTQREPLALSQKSPSVSHHTHPPN